MGRKFNSLAAQVRIIKTSLRQDGDSVPMGLQDLADTLHRFHNDLAGRHHHFGSQALDQCRHLVTSPHYKWARQIDRAAASERRNPPTQATMKCLSLSSAYVFSEDGAAP